MRWVSGLRSVLSTSALANYEPRVASRLSLNRFDATASWTTNVLPWWSRDQ